MNEQQKQKRRQLLRMCYINVTGLTCLSYGQKEMRFRVPTTLDYSGLKHISGEDFIFLLLEDGQTWFKKVNLNVARRCSLYYMEGTSIVAMDGNNPVNTQGTVLVYPFEFDSDELEKRKVDPDCVIIEKSSHVISSAAVMEIISAKIIKSVENFLYRLLTGRNNKELRQFPNKPFLEAFNSTLVQESPLPENHLRNFYLMVILQAQIEGRYPYNLSQAEFIDLVEIPQPPMKFKVAEVAAESH